MTFETDEEEIIHKTNKFLSQVFGRYVTSPSKEDIPYTQEHKKILKSQIITYKKIITGDNSLKEKKFTIPFKTDPKQFEDWFRLNEKNDDKFRHFYPNG